MSLSNLADFKRRHPNLAFYGAVLSLSLVLAWVFFFIFFAVWVFRRDITLTPILTICGLLYMAAVFILQLRREWKTWRQARA